MQEKNEVRLLFLLQLLRCCKLLLLLLEGLLTCLGGGGLGFGMAHPLSFLGPPHCLCLPCIDINIYQSPTDSCCKSSQT